MTRLEKAAEVRRLRDEEGLIFREIGERMGLARSTVHDLYVDPTGEKVRERKARYAKPCAECGTMLNPGGFKGTGLCHACAAVKRGEEIKVWTRENLINAVQRWAERFGEPPGITNWCPTRARQIGKPWLAVKYVCEKGTWPHAQSVIREFGSWNAGIEAAGFEPRPAHYPARRAA